MAEMSSGGSLSFHRWLDLESAEKGEKVQTLWRLLCVADRSETVAQT